MANNKGTWFAGEVVGMGSFTTNKERNGSIITRNFVSVTLKVAEDSDGGWGCHEEELTEFNFALEEAAAGYDKVAALKVGDFAEFHCRDIVRNGTWTNVNGLEKIRLWKPEYGEDAKKYLAPDIHDKDAAISLHGTM